MTASVELTDKRGYFDNSDAESLLNVCVLFRESVRYSKLELRARAPEGERSPSGVRATRGFAARARNSRFGNLAFKRETARSQ